MNIEFKSKVLELWNKYFPGTEEPIAAFYADTLHGATLVKKPVMYAQNAR